MSSDGYSLDDKRLKLAGFGDLQDIVAKYHAHSPAADTNRTQKCFFIPRAEIEANNYDLSLGRYKEEVVEDVQYDTPRVILSRLLEAEVGTVDEADLDKVQGGIVRELLALREIVG
jgi:type I restriction enzyme M protein